jgi:hypothetical protein
MNQKARRFLLLVSIVTLGSILIFLDTPIVLVISGTVLAGFIVMVVIGALRLSDLKPSRWRAREGQTQEKKPAKPDPTPKSAKGREIFSSIRSSLSAFRSGLSRFSVQKKEIKTQVKRIDEQLDKALSERPAAPVTPERSSAPQPPLSLAGADPFSALSAADLEGELIGGIGDDEDLATLNLSLDADQAPVSLDQEPDEVAEILKAHQEELAEFDGLSDTDPLATLPDTFDDVDLGALDLETEAADRPQNPMVVGSDTAVQAAPDRVSAPVPVAPPVAREENTGNDILSFAAGSARSDDLISLLKSDASQTKKGKDLSLLRDLKDMHVEAGELVAELEETVAALKSKKG